MADYFRYSWLSPRPGQGNGGIIAMAHGMHRIAIAEGVETAEQLDFLRSEGCDEIQGYYFSQPLEDAGLVRYVKERGWSAQHLPA